jgi:hypothetical protein
MAAGPNVIFSGRFTRGTQIADMTVSVSAQ